MTTDIDFLKIRLSLNQSEPPEGKTGVILGMRCTRVQPYELEVGDFEYYYSSQLDAFSVYEILSIYPPMKREIDSDWKELSKEDLPNSFSTYNTFWRASPDARQEGEILGVVRRRGTGIGAYGTERVELRVKLYSDKAWSEKASTNERYKAALVRTRAFFREMWWWLFKT